MAVVACRLNLPKFKAQKTLAQMHRNRQNRCGFVYFIQEEELRRIKIGFTTSHPLERIKGLRNASSQVLKFIGFQLGDEKLEKRLHRQFWHLHRRAEWFDPGEDLLRYVAGLTYGNEFEKALQKYVPTPGDARSLGKYGTALQQQNTSSGASVGIRDQEPFE